MAHKRRRHFIISLYVIALSFALIEGLYLFVTSSAAPSPYSYDQTPRFEPGTITHGSRDHKAIALTFDADMTPRMIEELHAGLVSSWYDQSITATLKHEQVPATIFTTGLWAEVYPHELKTLSQSPLFEIENHSFDHAGFTRPCYTLAPAHDKVAEIEDAQSAIHEITGLTPHYFRFPGGCAHADDIALVNKQGLEVIGWDVVSGDAFQHNKETIIKHVLSKVQNGSIIVMHLSGGPNAPATGQALPEIIHQLKARGYTLVTIKELLKL